MLADGRPAPARRARRRWLAARYHRAEIEGTERLPAGPVLSRKQIPFVTTRFVDVLEAPEPLARLASPLAAAIMGGFALDKEGRDELVREARHFTGRELKRRLLALMRTDLFPRLGALTVPTLVVHGSRDWLVPWRSSRRAAALIPGARFELVQKAGHVPYLSSPDAFNRVVSEFLADVERSAQPARTG